VLYLRLILFYGKNLLIMTVAKIQKVKFRLPKNCVMGYLVVSVPCLIFHMGGGWLLLLLFKEIFTKYILK